MAKAASIRRSLRSMTRAVKLQRSLVAKLLDVCAPAPKKRPRKAGTPAAAKPAAAKPAAAKAPPRATDDAQPDLPPATGKWMKGLYPLALTPGRPVAQAMSYWLYMPDHAPHAMARQGWPLVVMLHGCQQSATEFAQGTRMNRLAEEKGYAALYPQQLVSAQPQRCWRWFDRSTQQGDGEAMTLAGLIGAVCERHPIDRGRIYVCGLSAGAGMAAVLALNHPELIAAVGMHSGPVFGAGHSPVGALHVMRHGARTQADAAILGVLRERALPVLGKSMPPMPAILIHGEDDRVVRPVNQEQLARQWLQVNGLPVDMAARVVARPAGRGGSRQAHEIHDYLVGAKVLVRVARIAGLGHAWSGGDPAWPFTAKAGPDASRMLLDFFGKHRRQG